jgi:hypothetical protein
MEGMQSDVPQKGLTRREALKRGIAVGTLVWAVPVVQAVGIRPAYAMRPSGGCTRYCLKWEPGGPSGTDTCPPTPDGQLPLPDVLLGWVGTWSALGGRPARGSDSTSSTDTFGIEQGDASTGTTQGDTSSGLGDPSTGPADGTGDTLGDSPTGSDGALGLGTDPADPTTQPVTTLDTVPLDGSGEAPGTSGDAPGQVGKGSDATTTTTDAASVESTATDQGPPHDVPPSSPPGNCLDCPEDDYALNSLPRGIDLNEQVAIYGSPEGGFTVTYPGSWKLAELDSGNPVAAKCGSARSTAEGTDWCNTNPPAEVAPCDDPSRKAFWVGPCTNGHAISHIEIILDVC